MPFSNRIDRRDFALPVELPEPWPLTFLKLSFNGRLRLYESFDPLIEVSSGVVSRRENSQVRRSLDLFHVSEAHLAVRRYKQPSLAVAQLDHARVFHALFLARFCVKALGEWLDGKTSLFQSSYGVLTA